MSEKLFRNWIKGLSSIGIDLTNLVNSAYVAFCQIISTIVPFVMLLIQSKYQKKYREMVKHPEMVWMLP